MAILPVKILLLGKSGQLGRELERTLAPLGELVSLGREDVNGLSGDLSNHQSLRQTLCSLRPDIVVNAAAYTSVDRAESEPELAFIINAEAVKVLAETMAELGGWLVHFSTDYVFDGSGKAPWQETDNALPVNQYGLSKLAGEQAIIASGCQHLILRSSWIYGVSGSNFISTMLRLACQQENIAVVDDQVGAPTSAVLVAEITTDALRQCLMRPELSGIYHLAAAGQVSRYDLACFVIDCARNNGEPVLVKHIDRVRSEDYPMAARRPLNSRLDTTRLERTFQVALPPWQADVPIFIASLLAHRHDQITDPGI